MGRARKRPLERAPLELIESEAVSVTLLEIYLSSLQGLARDANLLFNPLGDVAFNPEHGTLSDLYLLGELPISNHLVNRGFGQPGETLNLRAAKQTAFGETRHREVGGRGWGDGDNLAPMGKRYGKRRQIESSV